MASNNREEIKSELKEVFDDISSDEEEETLPPAAANNDKKVRKGNDSPLDMPNPKVMCVENVGDKKKEEKPAEAREGSSNETPNEDPLATANINKETLEVITLPVNLQILPSSDLTDLDYMPSTSKAAAERRLMNNMKNNAPVIEAQVDEVYVQNIDAFCENLITEEGLTCWVETHYEPQLQDIKVFTGNCLLLVDSNRLSELFDSLVLFFRLIMQFRQHSCTWHVAFRIIQYLIDEYSLKISDRKLFFNLVINCDNCSECDVADSSLWDNIVASHEM